MVLGIAVLVIACGLGMQSDPPTGSISGRVVNASRDGDRVAGTEVVLRVGIDGRFVSVESTTTGPDGRFTFDKLPVGTGHVYLPGANWADVHFPGPRIELTEANRRVAVEIRVFESVAEPNPLVIEQMDVVIRTRPGSLHVTETLRIVNPTTSCFVGAPRHAGGGPVTLQLHVPVDFERITFVREGFGRRFAVINDKLVTGIPWPPGSRELKFSYVIANDQRHRTWSRPLDLPCEKLQVRIETDSPDEVVCNLASLSGAGGAVVYESQAELPAGYRLEVELGKLPISVMAYGRYAALLLLVLSVAAAIGFSVVRRGGAIREDERDAGGTSGASRAA